MHKEDLRLGAREIRGPPPLFLPIEQPPRDPPETCKQPFRTLSATHRASPARGKEKTVQGRSSRNRPNAQRRSRSGGEGAWETSKSRSGITTTATRRPSIFTPAMALSGKDLHLHPDQGHRRGRCMAMTRPDLP
jgi:hypothetical protein